MTDAFIDDMLKEAKLLQNKSGQNLDKGAYQKLTTYLLLHRKMESASSKIRKEVKGGMKRETIRNLPSRVPS